MVNFSFTAKFKYILVTVFILLLGAMAGYYLSQQYAVKQSFSYALDCPDDQYPSELECDDYCDPATVGSCFQKPSGCFGPNSGVQCGYGAGEAESCPVDQYPTKEECEANCDLQSGQLECVRKVITNCWKPDTAYPKCGNGDGGGDGDGDFRANTYLLMGRDDDLIKAAEAGAVISVLNGLRVIGSSQIGTPVKLKYFYSVGSQTAKDVFSIVPKDKTWSTAPTDQRAWSYWNGLQTVPLAALAKASGSIEIMSVSNPGIYQVVAYTGGGFNDLNIMGRSNPFTAYKVVTPAKAVTLVAKSTTVYSGSTFSVAWSNPNTLYPKDWIALVPQGQTWQINQPWTKNWVYTDGLASGIKSITLQTNTPTGAYDLVYYQNNTYIELKRTPGITVSAGTVTLTIPTAITKGVPFTIYFSVSGTTYSGDWIALTAPNTKWVTGLPWKYTNNTNTLPTTAGPKTGSITLTLPTASTLTQVQFVYYQNNVFTELKRSVSVPVK